MKMSTKISVVYDIVTKELHIKHIGGGLGDYTTIIKGISTLILKYGDELYDYWKLPNCVLAASDHNE